jgi:hypothetical protein
MIVKSPAIQTTVNIVNESVSSIFTKEDVLKLIDNINIGVEIEKERIVEQEVEAALKASSTNQVVLTQDQISTLNDMIYGDIESQLDQMRSGDVVDCDTAEFSLNYNNQVELNSVDIDTSSILRKVTERTREVIEKYIKYINLPVEVMLGVE